MKLTILIPLVLVHCAGEIKTSTQTQQVADEQFLGSRVRSVTVPPYGSPEIPLHPDFACSIQSRNDGLWMVMLKSGRPQFDFRVGAGGVIDQFRDLIHENSPLIMGPSYPGNITDRVFQETMWSFRIKNPETGAYLNVNQAGSDKNLLNPTSHVRIDREKCVIEVYSIPQIDWNSDKYWNSFFPTVTRYQLEGNGILLMRHAVQSYALSLNGGLLDNMPTSGQRAEVPDFTLSLWLPFDKRFNTAAFHFVNETPDWHYSLENLGNLGQSVDKTYGFIGLYNKEQSNSDSATLGVIYGTKLPACYKNTTKSRCGTDVAYVLTSMLGKNGDKPENFIFAPNIIVNSPLPTNTFLVRDVFLYPEHAFNASIAQQWQNMSTNLSEPAIFYPGASIPPNLVDYANFFANPTAAAATENLVPLIR